MSVSTIQKLTIAVPVYNEEKRVEEAIKQLLSVSFPIETEILVVDDGSRDRTWQVLQALDLPGGVRCLRHDKNRGKGAALRTALHEAAGDVFVPFDADLEYDPRELPNLLVPLIEARPMPYSEPEPSAPTPPSTSGMWWETGSCAFSPTYSSTATSLTSRPATRWSAQGSCARSGFAPTPSTSRPR